MFNVVLVEPEIPANTGNIIRLCANTGARLHLIEPLGFVLDDRRLKRAGLDYRDWADVQVHPNLVQALAQCRPPNLYAYTTRGQRRYSDVRYQPNDALLFGAETRGLPATVVAELPAQTLLRLPLQPGDRSLEPADAGGVGVYEAWRQL